MATIPQPRTLKGLKGAFRKRRYTQSKVLRKIIDRNQQVTQIFTLDEKYFNRYNKFVDVYNNAIKGMSQEEAERSRKIIDFGDLGGGPGGQGEGKITVGTATKVVTDKANFRQNKNFYNKLVPELKESHEAGHKNISILRANISIALQADTEESYLTKKERKQLVALREIVEEIDKFEKITGSDKEAKVDLIEHLRNIAEAGPERLELKWQKDVELVSGKSKGSIEIEMEYEQLNQFKGRLASWVGEIFSKIIEKDEEIFEEVFAGIDITKIKGSPTMEEDIENAFVEYLGRGRKKNYRAKKPTPTKDADKSISKKTAKPKGRRKRTKTATTVPLLKKPRGPAKRPGAASMPLKIMVMLNSQLPSVVEKNMQPPALEKRTGRFAASTRVTDVATTAQGFPSIGYTYQKNPYQTFETGFKQGSSERDPRKLIDKSIREIAVQFALGRLYTRRV